MIKNQLAHQQQYKYFYIIQYLNMILVKYLYNELSQKLELASLKLI